MTVTAPPEDWLRDPLLYHREINRTARRLMRGDRLRLIGVASLVTVAFSVPLVALSGDPTPFFFVAAAAGGGAAAWHARRARTVIERVVRATLCFQCGYSLRGLASRGAGFCPECGHPFRVGHYAPPRRGYIGGRVDDLVAEPSQSISRPVTSPDRHP